MILLGGIFFFGFIEGMFCFMLFNLLDIVFVIFLKDKYFVFCG